MKITQVDITITNEPVDAQHNIHTIGYTALPSEVLVKHIRVNEELPFEAIMERVMDEVVHWSKPFSHPHVELSFRSELKFHIKPE